MELLTKLVSSLATSEGSSGMLSIYSMLHHGKQSVGTDRPPDGTAPLYLVGAFGNSVG